MLSRIAPIYTTDAAAQHFMFTQFKREHYKTYDQAEEPTRFANFVNTLKAIDERNQAETGTAVHGMYVRILLVCVPKSLLTVCICLFVVPSSRTLRKMNFALSFFKLSHLRTPLAL